MTIRVNYSGADIQVMCICNERLCRRSGLYSGYVTTNFIDSFI